jgi:hydrogenase expression/formation protein HypE
MARKSSVEIFLEEEQLPINPSIKAAAEMLGIDVLEVANEGKAIIGVEAGKAEEVLEAIKTTKYGKNAAMIGQVNDGTRVLMRTQIGGTRFVDAPLGDPVPRVC